MDFENIHKKFKLKISFCKKCEPIKQQMLPFYANENGSINFQMFMASLARARTKTLIEKRRNKECDRERERGTLTLKSILKNGQDMEICSKG